ncbi:MAG: energy transducer TonB [Bacteroidales bacterium]
MKSSHERVPGFDEIIFENRNQSYGAYDLRKRYKLTASLSIIGGVSLSAMTLILISGLTPEPVPVKPESRITVTLTPDNLTDPDKIVVQVPQKPVALVPQYRYIEPAVVDDTVDIDLLMMPADFAIVSVINGDITDVIDSVKYIVVTDEPYEQEPFTFVEEPAIFPGGEAALLKYIAENTRYPSEAIENNIQGKVFVKFAVSANGAVNRIEILRGVHPLLDKEAVRVVSTLPKWIPGKQNGRPVPTWFNVPVDFQVKFY